MSKGAVFNGQKTYQPGVYSESSFQTLVGRTAGNGVLGVVGDFSFLEGNQAYYAQSISQLKAIAPMDETLLEVTNLCYNSSTDPNALGVPAGIYLISASATTQAVATVGDSLTLKSDIWGPLGNLTSVVISPDGDGYDITIANSGFSESITVGDATNVLTVDYDVPAISQTGVFQILSTDGTTEIFTLDGTHGWSADDQVELFAGPGGALPTGFSADTTYYVLSPSGATLKLSATSGPGSAKDIASGTLGGGTAPIYMKLVATRRTARGFTSVTAETNAGSGVDVKFSRTLDEDFAGTSASHTSWNLTDLPVNGTITVTPAAGTLSTGPNLNVKFTGRDSTGATATETLTFTTVQIGAGSPAKTTTKSWSSLTSVSIWSDAASITDWSGSVAITGNCFPTFNAANGYQYVNKVLSRINTFAAAGFAATTESGRTGQIETEKLDIVATTSVPVTFGGTIAAIAEAINTQSSFVTVTVDEYTPLGLATATEYALGGGSATTGGTDDYAAALVELRAFDIDAVCALTTTAAVHAKLLAHCNYMQGNGRNDRQGFIGAAASESFSALKARAVALGTGNADIMNAFCDEIQVVSFDGSSKWLGPHYAALQAAALSAGNLRTSLTRKRPSLLAHRRNAALMGEAGESDLIQIGFTPLSTPPGATPRYARWVTLWLEDESDIRTDGAAVRSRMLMYKALRAGLDPLIGEWGTSATQGLIESRAIEVMDQLERDGVITRWKRDTLNVAQTGNTWVVELEAQPATTILFIGAKVTFSVPTT